MENEKIEMTAAENENSAACETCDKQGAGECETYENYANAAVNAEKAKESAGEQTENSAENDYYEFKKALDDMNAELNAEKESEETENVSEFNAEKQFDAPENNESYSHAETIQPEIFAETAVKNDATAEAKPYFSEKTAESSTESDEKRRYQAEFNAFKYAKFMSAVDYDMTTAWTVAEVKGVLDRAKVYKFATCAVTSDKIKALKSLIKTDGYKICAVCGGNGGCAVPVLVKEMAFCKWYGACEFDVTLPVSVVKDGKKSGVKRALKTLKRAAGAKRVIKVGIDFSALTADEVKNFIKSAVSAKIDYIILRGRAAEESVTTVRALAGGAIKIEAAREVRGLKELSALLDSGVDKVYVKGTPALADDLRNQLENN